MNYCGRSNGMRRAVQALRSSINTSSASRMVVVAGNMKLIGSAPVSVPQYAHVPSFSSMPSMSMSFAASSLTSTGEESGDVESGGESSGNGLTSGSDTSAESLRPSKKRKSF